MILIGDGFNQKLVTGQPNPWKLAGAVQAAGLPIVQYEAAQNDDSNAPTVASFNGVNAVAGYSWFIQTISDLFGGLWHMPLNDVTIIVLGVNVPEGGGPNWTPNPAQRCYCFQCTPDYSFPVSYPLANASWIDFDDPSLWQAILDNTQLNINCNCLAKSVWPIDLFGKIGNHTTVNENADLITLCVKILKQFSPQAPASSRPTPNISVIPLSPPAAGAKP